MNNELNAFIAQKRIQKITGRNRLAPFKNEIEYLKNHGMAYQDIVDYLKTKNIEVTIQAVGYFCRKHFPSEKSTAIGQVPVKKYKPLNDRQEDKPAENIPTKTTSSTSNRSNPNWTPPPWADQDIDIDALLGKKQGG